MQVAIEAIKTNVTANYCHNWTMAQCIKEAAQNIVYGAVKAEMKPILKHENGVGTMEDGYIGFEKRHLFFGESEQRNDQDGLGNFGEGWKMFLLICARNNVPHLIETVGFSFYGVMSETGYGVKALEIVVEDNNREIGTKVTVECTEEDFKRGTEGFAVVQGIEKEHLGEASLIPNRQGELYIKGVRIENNESTNPLQLKYAYSIKDSSLTNRDRSTVNTNDTYSAISRIWATQEDESVITEYIKNAFDGDIEEDVQRGPSMWNMAHTIRPIWANIIANIHNCKVEELVIPSRNMTLDREAVYRGYTLANMPDKWNWALESLGFKNASEVVKAKFSDMEEINIDDLTESEYHHLKRAKIDAKKAFKLDSIKELPPIIIVAEIKDLNGVTDADGLYDREKRTVYLKREILMSQRYASRVLIHEVCHHVTQAPDNSEWFTRGFEQAIINLLGY